MSLKNNDIHSVYFIKKRFIMHELPNMIKTIFPNVTACFTRSGDLYYRDLNITYNGWTIIYHYDLSQFEYEGKLYSEKDFVKVLKLLTFL